MQTFTHIHTHSHTHILYTCTNTYEHTDIHSIPLTCVPSHAAPSGKLALTHAHLYLLIQMSFTSPHTDVYMYKCAYTHTHTHTHTRTHARTHAHTHTQLNAVHRLPANCFHSIGITYIGRGQCLQCFADSCHPHFLVKSLTHTHTHTHTQVHFLNTQQSKQFPGTFACHNHSQEYNSEGLYIVQFSLVCTLHYMASFSKNHFFCLFKTT